MRPIDPTNPSYYWKPLPGGDGKAGGSPGSTIDSILGAQVCLLGEGGCCMVNSGHLCCGSAVWLT
jgi:hypothetical protein